MQKDLCNRKKSYARMLESVLEAGKKEGASIPEIIADVKTRFNKECFPSTAEEILKTLKSQNCVEDVYGDGKVWRCAEHGELELKAARMKKAHYFERSTSPSVPMHV
jgi:hypothetical protein